MEEATLAVPDRASFHELKVRLALKDDDWKRALEEILLAAEADRRSAFQLNGLLIQVLNRFPDPEDVLKFHALNLANPLSERILFESIFRFWSQGQNLRAKGLGTQFLQLYPTSAHAVEVRAKIYGPEPARPPGAPIVGLLLPLKGAAKNQGDRVREAIELGAGRNDFRFEVEDASGTPEEIEKAYLKLTGEKKALVVVGPIQGPGSAEVAARSAESGVPTFLMSRVDFASTGFAYQMGLTDRDQARFLARTWIEDRKKKNFILLGAGTPAGEYALNRYQEQIQEFGGKVLYRKAYSPDQKDFRSVLAPIAKSLDSVDVIWIADSARKAALILPTLRFQGAQKQVVLGPSGWNEVESRRLLSQSGFSVFVADGVNLLALSSAIRRFRDQFSHALGRTPSVLEAVAYDTGAVVKAALKTQDSRKSRESLRKNILGLDDLSGASGDLTFTKRGIERKVLLIPLHSEGN
jgi:ABC-type branched-subunit amino acid transport system substrate-binding protein